MDPKIPSSFWSRRELETAKPETLLAVLWLYTNPRLTLVGYGEISARFFEFETRLPFAELERACQALGKGLVRHEDGYWLRDAIANNFGRGASLGASHMALALMRAAEGLGRAWVALAIEKEYPELSSRWEHERARKGLHSPSQVLPKDQSRAEQNREEQSREGKGAGKGSRAASARPTNLAEVVAYANEQQLGISEAECAKFFDHFEANGWRQGGRTPLRSWQAALRNWARRAGEGFAKNFVGTGAASTTAEFDPAAPNAHTGGAQEAV